MVTVSAPGKIFLMGEHAVVYGRPGLLAAVDKRVRVSVSKGRTGLDIQTDSSVGYIRHAVRCWQRSSGVKELPPLKIRVESDFLAGYHLGSSAAVAVAVVAALGVYFKKPWDPAGFASIAEEIERKAHGTASGADTAIVARGGLLWYRRETEFLKTVSPLSIIIAPKLNHFWLVDTGLPKETTKEMVSLVRAKWERRKTAMKKMLKLNEQITKRVLTAVVRADETGLIAELRAGEKTMEVLGAVSRSAQRFVRAVERSGGAAKILGGGGRRGGVGFLLVYHGNKKVLEQLVKRVGYSVEAVELGCEGVRIEK